MKQNQQNQGDEIPNSKHSGGDALLSPQPPERYVEVYDMQSRGYRPATLLRKSAPSKAGDGWYFQWDDISLRTANAVADGTARPSEGGWAPVSHIRLRATQATASEK